MSTLRELFPEAHAEWIKEAEAAYARGEERDLPQEQKEPEGKTRFGKYTLPPEAMKPGKNMLPDTLERIRERMRSR